ncbi:MAG: hypothetical protein ACREYE_23895 [Gammaproteobacteria bacterium]
MGEDSWPQPRESVADSREETTHDHDEPNGAQEALADAGLYLDHGLPIEPAGFAEKLMDNLLRLQSSGVQWAAGGHGEGYCLLFVAGASKSTTQF